MPSFFDRICRCGVPQRHAEDPQSPVTFDPQLNEFQIVSRGTQLIIRYCYWCGGRLPQSRRGLLFWEMDKKELEQARELCQQIRSLEDATRVLGSPDKIVPAPNAGGGFDRSGLPVDYTQSFRYFERWKTIELQIHELPNGQVSFSLQAKRLDLAPPPAPTARWSFLGPIAKKSSDVPE